MQNRYVGDIGDFVKLGILRALSPGHHLGVAWWLYPEEDHNKDGRHISYLNQPEQWRHFDPPLFDALSEIVATDRRNVRAVEAADILPGTILASEVIPVAKTIAERLDQRRQWFTTVQHSLAEADLLFLDPDNGLEPAGHPLGSAKAGKSILLTELRALATPGRCLIVYHHQTRWKGGHHAEIEYWADRLRECSFARVDALRAKPFSPVCSFCWTRRMTFGNARSRSALTGRDGSRGTRMDGRWKVVADSDSHLTPSLVQLDCGNFGWCP